MADERLIAHIDLDASGLQQGAASATRTLNKLGQQTVQAGASARRMGVDFMGTSRVMQDFAFGPAAIANNMEGLAREFQQMQRISKETGQTLTQTLVASLTGGGGLNLAVGALTFGMSLASVGMAAWTRIIDGHSKAAKKAAQDYKFLTDSVGSYNQSLQQGLKSGQDELAHLTRLQAVVQNNALSANERKEAYTELVKTYPTYFRSLSQEQVMAGNVGNAYATLRTRILEVAQARAVEGKIGKLAEKQLDIQQALGFQSKMIPKIKQQIIDYMNANSQFAKVQDAATISSEDFEAAIKRWRTGHFANKEFDGLVDKLNTYRERAKASEAANNQLTGSIETLSKSAALTNVGLSVDPLAGDVKNTKTKVSDLQKAWKDYANSISDIDKQIGAGILSGKEETQARFNAVTSGMRNLINSGLSPLSVEFGKLRLESDSLWKSLNPDSALKGWTTRDLINRLQLPTAKEMDTILNHSIKANDVAIKLGYKLDSRKLSKLNQDIQEQLNIFKTEKPIEYNLRLEMSGKSVTDFEKDVADTLQRMNSIVENSVNGFTNNIGELIGKAVSGSLQHGEALSLLLMPVADTMRMLGEEMIKNSTIIIAAKKAIASIFANPFAGLAAGAALVAAGAAIKGALSKAEKNTGANTGGGNFGYRPVPFANGGIVSGPTLGLVGEYANARNNPEVIAPLDKLKGMLGGGSQVQVMIPDVRFSNEAMYISFKRGERSYKSKT